MPNLVDYARVLLGAAAFALVPPSRPAWFLGLYLLNFALDGVDGILARRLNQTSTFGAFLDVVIDNTLRALMWAKALPLHWAAPLLPCLEWLVFTCSMSQAADDRSQWKQSFAAGPWWVGAVMANGFKNPAGCLAVAGLHFLPVWVWLRLHHPDLLPPLAHLGLGLVLLLGRLLALVVEVWVVVLHARSMLLADAQNLHRTQKRL